MKPTFIALLALCLPLAGALDTALPPLLALPKAAYKVDTFDAVKGNDAWFFLE